VHALAELRLSTGWPVVAAALWDDGTGGMVLTTDPLQVHARHEAVAVAQQRASLLRAAAAQAVVQPVRDAAHVTGSSWYCCPCACQELSTRESRCSRVHWDVGTLHLQTVQRLEPEL
jgi:hypothetical protein